MQDFTLESFYQTFHHDSMLLHLFHIFITDKIENREFVSQLAVLLSNDNPQIVLIAMKLAVWLLLSFVF